MRRLAVLLAGRGAVGTALAAQLTAARQALAGNGVDLRLVAVAGRAELALERAGFEAGGWRERFAPVRSDAARQALAALATVRPLALVDATADAEMGGVYVECLSAGAHVASCNKLPFTRSQAEYDRLVEASRGGGALLRFESTVGAGLPTLRTLRDLCDSGDRVEEVSGCFSGTLNFLCAGLDAGRRFSELLLEARRLGYTEPDPREDLSGRDVARKALILGRLAGGRMEPSQVSCRPLVETDGGTDLEGFLGGLERLDIQVGERVEGARRSGKLLRYVARATGSSASCGPCEVEQRDPLARLSGPENIFVYRTQRYSVPLVISGPGAGPEVTAAGIFSDLLEIARAAAGGADVF